VTQQRARHECVSCPVGVNDPLDSHGGHLDPALVAPERHGAAGATGADRPAGSGRHPGGEERSMVGESLAAHDQDVGGLDELPVELGGAVVVVHVAPQRNAGRPGDRDHLAGVVGQVRDHDVGPADGVAQRLRYGAGVRRQVEVDRQARAVGRS